MRAGSAGALDRGRVSKAGTPTTRLLSSVISTAMCQSFDLDLSPLILTLKQDKRQQTVMFEDVLDYLTLTFDF